MRQLGGEVQHLEDSPGRHSLGRGEGSKEEGTRGEDVAARRRPNAGRDRPDRAEQPYSGLL
eukprot:12208158-Alexandrium_andersonii.AAC.1